MASSHLWYFSQRTSVPWMTTALTNDDQTLSHMLCFGHTIWRCITCQRKVVNSHLWNLLIKSHPTVSCTLLHDSDARTKQKQTIFRKRAAMKGSKRGKPHAYNGTSCTRRSIQAYLRRAAPYWLQNWKRWTAFNRTHSMCSLPTQRLNSSVPGFRINHCHCLVILLPWLSRHSSLPNHSILHPIRSLTTT